MGSYRRSTISNGVTRPFTVIAGADERHPQPQVRAIARPASRSLFGPVTIIGVGWQERDRRRYRWAAPRIKASCPPFLHELDNTRYNSPSQTNQNVVIGGGSW